MAIAALLVLSALAQADIDAARVEAFPAIRKGIEYLRTNNAAHLLAREHVNRRVSNCELVLYVYAVCGLEEKDADLNLLLDDTLKNKLEATYCVALQAMALEEIDRVKHQKRLWQCSKFLLDNQSSQGNWGYGTPSALVNEPEPKGKPAGAPGGAVKEQSGLRARPAVVTRLRGIKDRDGQAGDNSNTYFATLGLRACHDSGIQLPPNVVDLAMKWLRDCQKKDKLFGNEDSPVPGVPKNVVPQGWCYGDHAEHRAYGSMTAAMVSCLAIWDYIKDNDDGKKKSWKKDPDVHEGLQWLAKNYSVTYNPGAYEHAKFMENSLHNYPYYMHALSGVGLLYGTETLGARKWYVEGVKALVASQGADGRWGDGTIDTCFALLFLIRGTRWLSPF